MSLLVGIDEVGLGPLAGPVVAAAVLIEDGAVPGVRDSKKVPEGRRYALAEEIRQKAKWFHIARRGPEDVNAHNTIWCWRAVLYEAAKAAHLAWPEVEILIDGPGKKEWRGTLTYARFVPGGDDNVYQVAAASLLAKAARDLEMIEMGEKFPKYTFGHHKGYGVPAHLAEIRRWGLCEIHRRVPAMHAIER
jgi:ribonuclease HII